MSFGRFITVEGSEGAGKTTALRIIKAQLEEAGIQVVETREPGGTPVGEKIREILLDKENGEIYDDTELMLMFAARMQHLQECILPNLRQGNWVLCDRFTDATYAYQGGGRGLDPARIETLENWVQGDFRPDLTLLLDLSVEIGLQRARARSEADRFEAQHLDFFERVRYAYLQRARQFPQQFRLIDAAQDLEHVHQQINQVMQSYIDAQRQDAS